MLTVRETDVLRLLSCGCAYKTIGEQLGISLHTVGSHIKSAYRKLEVHTGAAAVMRAAQLGLLGNTPPSVVPSARPYIRSRLSSS